MTNHEVLREAVPDEARRALPPLLPYVKSTRNSSESAALDSNHTHHVLVDHVDTPGWGSEIEMRGHIETRLSEKHNVPVIYLVISVRRT